MKSIVILSAFLVSVAADANIVRFRHVTDGIYRGSRPGSCTPTNEKGCINPDTKRMLNQDLDYLKTEGVKTILDLQMDEKDNFNEARAAKSRSIQVIHLPINPITGPDTKTVTKAMDTLNNQKLQPIYVHCEHGKDRTGLIIGLHRVIYQDFSPQVAMNEMLSIGDAEGLSSFDTRLVGLLFDFCMRTHEDKYLIRQNYKSTVGCIVPFSAPF